LKGLRVKKRLVIALLPLALAVTTLGIGGTTAQSQVPLQSPVNVTPGAVDISHSQPPLNVHYGYSDLELKYIQKDAASPAGCTTRNVEETEEAAVVPNSGYVTLAGVRYDLAQFHFHTPSEHRLNGHADPLEMHLVHKSAAGRILVIGVPLRIGAASTVDTVLASLSPECGTPVDISHINLNTLLPANHSTVRYLGSLTTAPYTEGVQWFLMTEKTVTQATVDRFKSVFVHGNARVTQPLNGRRLTAVPQN
jgi:carbonic anhydrase